MWNWLQNLSGGAATFVGSATGSGIGLIAILIGALFNAHLNRRRDDRIRKEDTRALATALRAELAGLLRTLEENVDLLKKEPPEEGGGFLAPDLGQSVRVMPEMLGKFGLLDVHTIRNVIDSYLIVEQFGAKLLLLGGTMVGNMPEGRRFISLPGTKTKHVVAMSEGMIGQIRQSIDKLDLHLKSVGRNKRSALRRTRAAP